MKILISVSLAATLMVTAGSALAADPRVTTEPRIPLDTPELTTQMVPDRDVWLAQMNRQTLTPSKVRWERARRAAALINADRCLDAYNLAVAEKDNKLAEGVVRACKSPGV